MLLSGVRPYMSVICIELRSVPCSGVGSPNSPSRTSRYIHFFPSNFRVTGGSVLIPWSSVLYSISLPMWGNFSFSTAMEQWTGGWTSSVSVFSVLLYFSISANSMA